MITKWLYVIVCWLCTNEIGTKGENIPDLVNCTVPWAQNIFISNDTNCSEIQIYNNTCVSLQIWKIEINNETCLADNSTLAESYCDYHFNCSLVSYQCYNNQSRIDRCYDRRNDFSNGSLILNVTALLKKYQDEFTICGSLLSSTSCTFETIIKITVNNDPITPTATRMASSIESSTSAEMSTSPTTTCTTSGASSLTAMGGTCYTITTLLLFLVSLFCSY